MLFPHGIFAFSFPIGRVITPQRAAVVGSDITPLPMMCFIWIVCHADAVFLSCTHVHVRIIQNPSRCCCFCCGLYLFCMYVHTAKHFRSRHPTMYGMTSFDAYHFFVNISSPRTKNLKANQRRKPMDEDQPFLYLLPASLRSNLSAAVAPSTF